MSEWKLWHPSKEEIIEILASKNGFILKNDYTESPVLKITDFDSDDSVVEYIKNFETTYYLIICDDPLRQIKIRQAETGQPVWYRNKNLPKNHEGDKTNFPNWNLRDVEYSLKPFNQEKS